MPNWCENILTVEGDKLQEFKQTILTPVSDNPAEYKRLKEAVAGATSVVECVEAYHKLSEFETQHVDAWLFSSTRPVPTGVDAYDWCVMNWGTKWDVCEFSLIEGDDSLVLTFETAWSPPREWVLYTSKLFPELTFVLHYREIGMGFGGSITVTGGEIVHEFCGTYEEAGEFFAPFEE